MEKKTQETSGPYLKSKDFRQTLLAILLFFSIVLLAAFLWLKLYTHHGQELELPDYTGIPFEEASRDAADRKFRMSIQDSLHILGKPGGLIIKQNPAPGSLVKSKRMIYVTITKRSPDKILSSRLPEMYGKSYERKKKELAEHFQIQSRIVDQRFDPGDPGQVLEVRYHGKTIIDAKGRVNDVQIEKGDFLEFVISAKSGGEVKVPDLVCKTYEEGLFLLDHLGLKIGDVIRDGEVEPLADAFIIAQSPLPDGSTIEMGATISVTVSLTRPESCP